jgi:hypothetical protein
MVCANALWAWHQQQCPLIAAAFLVHPTDDACVWQVQGGTHLAKASRQPSHLHSSFQLYCETKKIQEEDG